MRDVQRYICEGDAHESGMEPCDEGGWVRADDYDTLRRDSDTRKKLAISVTRALTIRKVREALGAAAYDEHQKTPGLIRVATVLAILDTHADTSRKEG